MTVIDKATFPLLPTKDTQQRMANFPGSVFQVNESSTLYKYIDAIVGDSGAGALKKELLIARLNQKIDTTYFNDLDRIFGNLGRITRIVSESYSINPSTDLLTTAEWDEIKIKDAWYRARIKDFFAALALGGTPDGLRKMVKAAIGVDCEIYEMWKFQDYYREIYGVPDLEAISNLIPTPSFEFGFTGLGMIAGTGASLIIDSSLPVTIQSGTKSIKFSTGTTTTNPLVGSITTIQASPSKQYTFGAYYYRPATNTVTTTANVLIYSYDINNVQLSLQTSSNINLLADTLDRLLYTFTTPANTYRIGFQIQFNGTVTTPAVLLYLDALSLTAGTVQAYFDGQTPGYRWTGEAGNSYSIKASPIDALSRLKVPARNEIIIYPHKSSLTVLEKELVREMTKRVAPVDSIITIRNSGYAVNVPIAVNFVTADSTYFQINSYVTGSGIVGLTEDEEENATHRWLQEGVEALAPNQAFMESQEYSQYYIFTDDSQSSIDSVKYFRQDGDGNEVAEQDYKIIEKTISSWSQWTLFDVADSPDKFPGGKNGVTPFHAPAINRNGSPYVFSYTSQLDYINQMKVLLNSVSGQTRTFKDVDTGDPTKNYDQAFALDLLTAEKGEYTEIEYRLPIAATESIINTWKPEEAMANKAPVKASTVTTGWYNRPLVRN
jgi:hypothetical protein